MLAKLFRQLPIVSCRTYQQIVYLTTVKLVTTFILCVFGVYFYSLCKTSIIRYQKWCNATRQLRTAMTFNLLYENVNAFLLISLKVNSSRWKWWIVEIGIKHVNKCCTLLCVALVLDCDANSSAHSVNVCSECFTEFTHAVTPSPTH